MEREGKRGSLTLETKQVEKRRAVAQAQGSQECSMCGDVGYANELQQCTRCLFRHQHTYCCNSKEGLSSGTWICDWCRLVKDNAKDDKESKEASVTCSTGSDRSVISGDSGAALECLLKAALKGVQDEAWGVQTSSADGASLCSSSIEGGGEGAPEATSCSSEDRLRDAAIPTYTSGGPRGSTNSCDLKRNPKVMRCMKNAQKSKRHGSVTERQYNSGSVTQLGRLSSPKSSKTGMASDSLLERQCGSVQLKRLPSLKNSKTSIVCDPPKSFVRRYKSLSDILV